MRQLKAASLPPSLMRAAVSLGAVAPALAADEATAQLGGDHGEQVVAFWYQQRVLRLALHRLSTVDSDVARRLLDAAADHAAATRRRIAALRAVWQELEPAAAELGIGISGIKGMTMQDRYEPYGPRDLGDVDLMMAGADEAWNLTAWLRQRGWEYVRHELPWIKRAADGHLYGQLVLANDEGGRVDIHFGGYSVRHNGLIPIDRPQPGLSVASLDANFGYLLANAAGDHVVRLKELNDVVVYLRAGDFDWSAARDRIRAVCLEGYWNALADRTLELEALGEDERRLLRSVRFQDVSPECPGFGVPDLRARRRATVGHARRYARRRMNRVGLRAALSAGVYYRMPLRLTVLPLPGVPGRTLLSRATTDRCVRLVPLKLLAPDALQAVTASGEPLVGSRALRRLTARGRQFAFGAGEMFVPTVYFLISRSVVKGASAAARRWGSNEGSNNAAASAGPIT